MKKFKRFLCIPLLVLFTMTLLTLPAAAAVKVLLPDGNPAASMTLLFSAATQTKKVFAKVEVTTDAQGVFAYPAGLSEFMSNAGVDDVVMYVRTNETPPRMMVFRPTATKDFVWDKDVTMKLENNQVLKPYH